MRFFAHHGCFAEEKTIGNYFIVDFAAETDMTVASESDNLEDALNYQLIYDIVKEEMAVPSNLLEHVAGRILRHFRRMFPEITSATVSISKLNVSISKLNPPLGGEVGASRVTMSL